jgi:8-oxo-dGTP pyrophosphatase MutT (NUDIX family)
MHYDRLEPVRAYLRCHPAEPELLRLRAQMETPESMFSRQNMAGHITASGFVLTPDHSETLIISHKGLDKWLQPGGHVDDDDSVIWHAARREIYEETGLTDIALDPWHAEHQFAPINIDTHPIPPRPVKQEGPHWHHDCLYVFLAPKISIRAQEDELSAACWCAIDDPRVPGRLRGIYKNLLHLA